MEQDHAGQASATRDFMGCDRHIGGRSHQQDQLACLSTPDLRRQLVIVADGVGGHWGGEMASNAVIDTARLMFPTALNESAGTDFLRALCTRASQEIQLRAAMEGEQAYATVVALLTDETRAYWAHVGDSRLYCFENDVLLHQTQDHSLVQNLFEQGKISAEERATHPDRNQILHALGMVGEVHPTLGEMSLNTNLRFLLCTDGFWSQVATSEMTGIFSAPDLNFATSLWVRQAARRGGAQSDNIALALWRPPKRASRGWSFFR